MALVAVMPLLVRLVSSHRCTNTSMQNARLVSVVRGIGGAHRAVLHSGAPAETPAEAGEIIRRARTHMGIFRFVARVCARPAASMQPQIVHSVRRIHKKKPWPVACMTVCVCVLRHRPAQSQTAQAASSANLSHLHSYPIIYYEIHGITSFIPRRVVFSLVSGFARRARISHTRIDECNDATQRHRGAFAYSRCDGRLTRPKCASETSAIFDSRAD